MRKKQPNQRPKRFLLLGTRPDGTSELLAQDDSEGQLLAALKACSSAQLFPAGFVSLSLVDIKVPMSFGGESPVLIAAVADLPAADRKRFQARAEAALEAVLA